MLSASRSLLATRHLLAQRCLFSARPFEILGLQQIAVGGLEKEPLTKLWVDVFGLTKVNTFVSESENVDEDILTLGEHPHAVEVDLMTPLDPEKSPKVRIL
jgi:lactoylglutathione lyase